MAAGTIISLLSNVPWGHVLEAAPKVADGATKLWNAVAKRQKEEGPIAPQNGAQSQAASLQEVRSQLESMRSTVEALKGEMQAATELIKALAEQNTALVQRVELNHRSLVRRTAALAMVSTGLLASVLYIFLKI